MKTILIYFSVSLLVSCTGSDERCGPFDETTFISGSFGTDSIVSWSDFTSSENNDCTQPDAPVSLLLEGKQRDGNRLMTFCLPRPDRLMDGPIQLSDSSKIQVIAVFADHEGCLISQDKETPLMGTVEFYGVCDNGKHQNGYSVTINATLAIKKTCQDAETRDTMRLTGSATVVEVTP